MKPYVCVSCFEALAESEVEAGMHRIPRGWCGAVHLRDGGKTVPEPDWRPDPDCARCGGSGVNPLDPLGDRNWCDRCGPPYLPGAPCS